MNKSPEQAPEMKQIAKQEELRMAFRQTRENDPEATNKIVEQGKELYGQVEQNPSKLFNFNVVARGEITGLNIEHSMKGPFVFKDKEGKDTNFSSNEARAYLLAMKRGLAKCEKAPTDKLKQERKIDLMNHMLGFAAQAAERGNFAITTNVLKEAGLTPDDIRNYLPKDEEKANEVMYKLRTIFQRTKPEMEQIKAPEEMKKAA